jgi:hypothetical protein
MDETATLQPNHSARLVVGYNIINLSEEPFANRSERLKDGPRIFIVRARLSGRRVPDRHYCRLKQPHGETQTHSRIRCASSRRLC